MAITFEELSEYLGKPPFGFTDEDCKLLWWTMQGILFRPSSLPDSFRDYLAASVDDMREGFEQMQTDLGVDPSDPEPPADRNLQYHDLVEKLLALDEEPAAQLYHTLVGYVLGTGDASEDNRG